MNLQNIPSKSKNIRLMFMAGKRDSKVFVNSSEVTLHITDEVETDRGFIPVSMITVRDTFSDGKNYAQVLNIKQVDDNYRTFVLGNVERGGVNE